MMNANYSLRNLYLNVLTVAIILCISLSCTRSINPNIEHGANYKYRAGYPEVRVSAVGFLDEDNQPSINLDANIVYQSLIFKEVNDSQQAKVTIDIRITDREDETKSLPSKHYDINVDEKEKNITNSQESYIFQKRLDVPPGKYKIYFTVTDLNSKKQIVRTQETTIPDPATNNIDLTDIRMLGKDMDTDSPEWLPLTTYDVPGRIDSLMFISQATNNNSEQPLSLNANLINFKADDSIARPMFFHNYSPSTIEYQGIRYSSDDVIQQSQRKLLEEGSVFIEFKFALPERGNYRFEIKSDKEDKELFKGRDFGVKSENYPTVKTPEELARPLVYLMGDHEYEDLMAIDNPDSLKEAIDRFWLKKIGDKNKAKNVIELYYLRVEEANKQFSNFKEGWKTDPGMVYILFGPPVYVNRRVDVMSWAYTNNLVTAQQNFDFIRTTVPSEFFPFTHYVLDRSQDLYQLQYQQQNLWLSGLILTRNF